MDGARLPARRARPTRRVPDRRPGAPAGSGGRLRPRPSPDGRRDAPAGRTLATVSEPGSQLPVRLRVRRTDKCPGLSWRRRCPNGFTLRIGGRRRLRRMVRDMTQTAALVQTNPGLSGRMKILLALILTGQFMAVLDASIVNVAIPTIRRDLGASGSDLQLIVAGYVVAGYVVAYAVLLITGARLGMRFGFRRAFLSGLALF